MSINIRSRSRKGILNWFCGCVSCILQLSLSARMFLLHIRVGVVCEMEESVSLLALFRSVSEAKCRGRTLLLACLSLSSSTLTVHMVVIVAVGMQV